MRERGKSCCDQNTLLKWFLKSKQKIYVRVIIRDCYRRSPCSRAIEAERIPRSRLRTVNAASHSDTILVTEDGSPATVPDDPIDSAACESLRFFKFPRNCHQTTTHNSFLFNLGELLNFDRRRHQGLPSEAYCMPPVNGSQQDQTHGAEALPSCESTDVFPTRSMHTDNKYIFISNV